MQKRTRVAIALVVVLGAAVAATLWWATRKPKDGPLVLYGNVDVRQVELAFRQPGRIVTMSVDEGDTVKGGQVVAKLDAQPYRDALASAEANARVARAQLDKLKAGNRPQEIAQAAETVRQAEATARNADRDFKRQSELLASGSSSQRTVDAARAQRDSSAASLAAARQAWELQRIGSRSEDIHAGEANLAAAEAQLAQARTALDDTTLVAPTKATVLARVIEPGSMVATSSPVYTLSLRDPVYVRAYVTEPQLGHIAPGTAVRIKTDSSARTYEGKIGFISPSAEFTPKSVETTDLRTDLVYRLRLVVADADEGLRQGMPVTVTIDASAR
ncbi:MAG TPA: secretion protein HlyD [Luteibacter sp.]|nr:secretion protein HlyD [Luteibacter sp.]